jgi:hypothetical protein
MPKNSPKKMPYKGKGLIDEAVMETQEAIGDLMMVFRTQGMSEAEHLRRDGIVMDRLHKVTKILISIPVEIKEEVKNENALGKSQSAVEDQNIQLQ